MDDSKKDKKLVPSSYLEPKNPQPLDETDKLTTYTITCNHAGPSTQYYMVNNVSSCRLNPMGMRVSTEFFACKYCECDLTSKEYLDNHEKYCKLKIQRRKGKLKKDNKIEKREFSTNLKTHMMNKQEKELKMFYCKVCKYKSYCCSNKKTHKASKFGCAVCNVTYRYKQNLDDHWLRLHPEKHNKITAKIHQCNYCSFKTVHKSKIHEHQCQSEEQNGSKKKLSCSQCDFATLTKRSLNSHMRIHSGVKKCLKCDNCHKRFATKRYLANHIVNKHNEDTLLMQSVTYPIYHCQSCCYQTIVIRNLRCHYKNHH